MEENEKRKAEVDDNGVGGWKMKKTKQREEEEEEEGWLSPWLDIAQWRKQKPPNPPQLVWRRPSSLSLSFEKNEEKSSAASQPLASRLSGMNARYLARKTYKVGRQKARRNLIQRKIHNR